MQFDLEKVRKKMKMKPEEFASICGLNVDSYMIHEKEGIIPCKYLYMLWKNNENFPVPEDFFYFTSFALQINMKYHRLTQTEVAKRLGWQQQCVSKYVNGFYPMYEMKELFLKTFQPFIIPFGLYNEGEKQEIKSLTDLCPKYNFVAMQRKRDNKKKRKAIGLTAEEISRIRKENKRQLLMSKN